MGELLTFTTLRPHPRRRQSESPGLDLRHQHFLNTPAPPGASGGQPRRATGVKRHGHEVTHGSTAGRCARRSPCIAWFNPSERTVFAPPPLEVTKQRPTVVKECVSSEHMLMNWDEDPGLVPQHPCPLSIVHGGRWCPARLRRTRGDPPILPPAPAPARAAAVCTLHLRRPWAWITVPSATSASPEIQRVS